MVRVGFIVPFDRTLNQREREREKEREREREKQVRSLVNACLIPFPCG